MTTESATLSMPTRRDFFAKALAGTSIAALFALDACGTPTPAPATGSGAVPVVVTPPPTPAPATGVLAVLEDVDGAVNSFLNSAGLGSTILGQVTNDIKQFEGVINSVASGGNLASLIPTGVGLIQDFSGVLAGVSGFMSGPYGQIISAAVSAIPQILSLAGLAGLAQRPNAALASIPLMDPASALTVLHNAASKVQARR